MTFLLLILTGQRRRRRPAVRGHRGGCVALPGVPGDRAPRAGGGAGGRRSRRHHVEQPLGIPVAAEETGRDIGVDTGERMRVCRCVCVFISGRAMDARDWLFR